MKLWAIADLHLGADRNRAALRELPAFPEDWLIVAGDVCEGIDLFAETMAWLAGRFACVFWMPGNHELWLTDRGQERRSSPAKYEAMVALARQHGVLTPEDPYLSWPPSGDMIVPLFTLYDYSFRPPDIALEDVVPWAAALRNVAADEQLISAAPMSGMIEWCTRRCEETALRLTRELPPGARTVLANHYPLRQDLVRIPRIPRFTPWCGTTRTEDWHLRFNARLVVSGHLHVRRSDIRDGVRFEEVSLGYPRQWDAAKGVLFYLRDITPEL